MTHAEAMRAAKSSPQVTPSAMRDPPLPVSNPYAVGTTLHDSTTPRPSSITVPPNTIAPVFSSPTTVNVTSSAQTPSKPKTRAETRRMTFTEKGDVYGFQKIEQDEDFLLLSSLEEYNHKS
jgi:hypothetical protein